MRVRSENDRARDLWTGGLSPSPLLLSLSLTLALALSVSISLFLRAALSWSHLDR